MICSECAAPVVLDRAHGEMICSECSLVAEGTVFDVSPNFDPAGGVVSHGPASGPNTGTSLITYISHSDDRFSHLSKLNVRTLGRRDRSAKRLHRAVSNLCLKLSVPPEVRARAFYLAKAARGRGAMRGLEFSTLSAAALLLAARESGFALDSEDIAAVAGISRRRPQRLVERAYRRMKRAFGVRTPRITPLSLLPAAAGRLGLSPADIRLVGAETALIERNHTARVDLAACIFIVARRNGWPLALAAVAEACGTTDVSIRNRVAELAPQYRFGVD